MEPSSSSSDDVNLAQEPVEDVDLGASDSSPSVDSSSSLMSHSANQTHYNAVDQVSSASSPAAGHHERPLEDDATPTSVQVSIPDSSRADASGALVESTKSTDADLALFALDALRVVRKESEYYRATHGKWVAWWSRFTFDLTVERLRTRAIPSVLLSAFVVIVVFRTLFATMTRTRDANNNTFFLSISAGLLTLFSFANDVRSGKTAAVVFTCFAAFTWSMSIFGLTLAVDGISATSPRVQNLTGLVESIISLTMYTIVFVYAVRLLTTVFQKKLPMVVVKWIALGQSMFVSKRISYNTHVRGLLSGRRQHVRTKADVRLSVRFTLTNVACVFVLLILATLCIGICVVVALYPVPQLLIDVLLLLEIFFDFDLERDFGFTIAELRKGLIFGVTLASLLTICLATAIIISWTNRYRNRLLLMRKGEHFFKRTSASIMSASWYPGSQVGHFMLGTAVLFMVSLLVFVPIGLALFIRGLFLFCLDSVWNQAGSAIVTWVVSVFLVWFCRRWITTKDGRTIAHLRRHMVFDMVMLCFGAVSCLVNVVIRLLWLVARFISALTRLDESVVPAEREASDGGYVNYISMVSMDHYYNSPVSMVAQDILMGMHLTARERCGVLDNVLVDKDAPPSPQVREEGQHDTKADHAFPSKESAMLPTDLSRRRARTRWLLAYTMLRNPSLVDLRVRQAPVIPNEPL
jgi:hypothetical protein